MASEPLNSAEALVLHLSRQSALTPWCYYGPRGKEAGKELCDVLVVCDPQVLIFSVKDIKFKDTDRPDIDRGRWERRAVEDSVKQIEGAERWLATAQRVIRSDGSPGLPLPPLPSRRTHRIAVAFGSRGQVPIGDQQSSGGFVHVMNEEGLQAILSELDTVTDLVEYLGKKEQYLSEQRALIMEGSEADLLGLYLHGGRFFHSSWDLVIVYDGIWNEVAAKTEFIRRKQADQVSYVWDRMIEAVAGSKTFSEPTPSDESDLELALRTMARESRFSRRLLGKALEGFLLAAKEGTPIRGRIAKGYGSTNYVFVHFKRTEAAQDRLAELTARCLIARRRLGSGEVVIGLGISEYIPDAGSAIDVFYGRFPDWSTADDERADRLSAETGFFHKPQEQRRRVDEYPES